MRGPSPGSHGFVHREVEARRQRRPDGSAVHQGARRDAKGQTHGPAQELVHRSGGRLLGIGSINRRAVGLEEGSQAVVVLEAQGGVIEGGKGGGSGRARGCRSRRQWSVIVGTHLFATLYVLYRTAKRPGDHLSMRSAFALSLCAEDRARHKLRTSLFPGLRRPTETRDMLY